MKPEKVSNAGRSAWTNGMTIHIYVYTHIYIYICTYTFLDTYIHISTYVSRCGCECVTVIDDALGQATNLVESHLSSPA